MKPLYVICVDDEEAFLETLVDYFSDSPYEVLRTSEPRSVIKLLNENGSRTVGIISDYRMPDMNGLELRQLILEKWKDIPFFVLSAFISKEMALDGISNKISAFIDKPTEKETLLNLFQKEAVPRADLIREEDELIAGFIDEATELLEEMEDLGMSIETAPSLDTINRIFAIAHTIKGTSAFFQPDTIHRFTHRFEDYLSKVKSGEIPLSPQVANVVLKVRDIEKMLIEELRNSQHLDHKIDELALVFTSSPEDKKEVPTQVQNQLKKKSSARQEIRVGINLLDRFMESAGETTVLRNMVMKLLISLEKQYPSSKELSLLGELLDEMHKINSTMQDQISDLRKIPIKSIFRPLTRTVRDLSTSLGKKVNFETEGEDLRVDNSVAEVLSNSLIHMIRNCMDHGLETEEERTKTGKDKVGSIRLSAATSGDQIVIEISDDGRGLNRDKIKARAVSNGILSKEEADAASDKKIYSMIFESGFSTAEKVTDLSGRGVGMDMVRASIEKLDGFIDIESELGKGSKFRITLSIPKSVLIINSLTVETHGFSFSIPQDNLVRLLYLESEEDFKQIEQVESAELLRLEGELVPLIPLPTILGIPGRYSTQTHKNIVVVKGKLCRFGILVESILDLEDSVVKPLGEFLSNIPVYKGGTFLADGSIGLILDADGIATQFGLGNSKRIVAAQSEETKEATHQMKEILVFSVGNKAKYAFPLQKIDRLEEVQTKKLQYSGEHPAILFRKQILPIVGADFLLTGKKHSTLFERESFPVLILAHGKRWVGLAVETIYDLILTETELDKNLTLKPGVIGNVMVNNMTISILDPDFFASKIFNVTESTSLLDKSA